MVKVALLAGSVLGDVARDGIRLLALLLAAVLIPAIAVVVIAALALATPFAGLAGAAAPQTGGAQQPPSLPVEHLAVMVAVEAETRVPWALLAGIASVESGFGRNMSTSWAGAIGYGQFLPSSWAAFGEGGDPYDYRDVIPAMARYLLAAHVLTDLPGAVHAYNHDWEYVALVLSRAAYYTAVDGEAAAALAAVATGGAR